MPRRRRRRTFPWIRLGLVALLALVLAGFGYLLLRPEAASSPAGPEAEATASAPPAAVRPPVPEQPDPAGAGAPPVARIALIIDDLGRSVGTVERLASLGAPITGAVLPFEPHSEAVARALEGYGLEVLCHLPMEPAAAGVNPGPGALERAMSAEQIRRATRRALAAVPGAIGANNHMGSAFSADAAAMRPVLEELASHGLLYIDSRTGPDSVGYRLAGAMAVPSAERDLFLDGVSDGRGIEERWRELLERARADGAAIAIAHPHETTLTFLSHAVPDALERGFELVPVSYLVDRPGNLPI